MIIIVPLGGVGKRFSEFGYKTPKPLIRALGKEIIFWLIDSLKVNHDDKIYIIYNYELDEYNFLNYFSKYKNINFLRLNKLTCGPVETILQLTDILKNKYKNEKTLILDGDTFYNFNILNKVRKLNHHSIFFNVNKSPEAIFSYIKFDSNNKVYEIKEKKKISNFANIGAYFFNNIYNLHNILKLAFKNNKKSYISDAYNILLKKKENIQAIKVKDFQFECLGTPKQLIDFCKKNQNINKRRFCFDLDNTLVSFPKIKGDYNTVEPIEKNIKYVNFLKSIGHTIIIYTARRMRTHNDDVKKVIKDIKALTLKQLKKFGINYDKLFFGKPFADFYIDDLAINAHDDLNFKIGFYNSQEDKTRNFNNITIGEAVTEKKSDSRDIILSEINYYRNLPKKLKVFFPKFLDYGKNWYKIETIKGVNFNYLLINDLLTLKDIEKLFYTISKFHNFKKKIKANIYDHYSKKLLIRFKNFNLNIKKKIDKKFFNEIKIFLVNYENFKYGKSGIIHGDPVFSNIIKKTNGNLCFVDPKGSKYEKNCLYGDIFYDHAKIYQSLTGYDHILDNKKIENDYSKKLLISYEHLLVKNYGFERLKLVKKIASSLYLTLLNFHEEKFANKFINHSKKLFYKSD